MYWCIDVLMYWCIGVTRHYFSTLHLHTKCIRELYLGVTMY